MMNTRYERYEIWQITGKGWYNIILVLVATHGNEVIIARLGDGRAYCVYKGKGHSSGARPHHHRTGGLVVCVKGLLQLLGGGTAHYYRTAGQMHPALLQ